MKSSFTCKPVNPRLIDLLPKNGLLEPDDVLCEAWEVDCEAGFGDIEAPGVNDNAFGFGLNENAFGFNVFEPPAVDVLACDNAGEAIDFCSFGGDFGEAEIGCDT